MDILGDAVSVEKEERLRTRRGAGSIAASVVGRGAGDAGRAVDVGRGRASGLAGFDGAGGEEEEVVDASEGREVGRVAGSSSLLASLADSVNSDVTLAAAVEGGG